MLKLWKKVEVWIHVKVVGNTPCLHASRSRVGGNEFGAIRVRGEEE